MAQFMLTAAPAGADNGVLPFLRAAMHFLALMIELAAIVTPIVGIVVELRRDIPDDDDRGLLQGCTGQARQQALSRA
jgi:hypothetical protein